MELRLPEVRLICPRRFGAAISMAWILMYRLAPIPLMLTSPLCMKDWMTWVWRFGEMEILESGFAISIG